MALTDICEMGVSQNARERGPKTHYVSKSVRVAVAQSAELPHGLKQTLLHAAQATRARLPPAGFLLQIVSENQREQMHAAICA